MTDNTGAGAITIDNFELSAVVERALQKQKTAAHLRWALTKPDSHNTGSEIVGTPLGSGYSIMGTATWSESETVV